MNRWAGRHGGFTKVDLLNQPALALTLLPLCGCTDRVVGCAYLRCA
jgi:hypothetical protein